MPAHALQGVIAKKRTSTSLHTSQNSACLSRGEMNVRRMGVGIFVRENDVGVVRLSTISPSSPEKR